MPGTCFREARQKGCLLHTYSTLLEVGSIPLCAISTRLYSQQGAEVRTMQCLSHFFSLFSPPATILASKRQLHTSSQAGLCGRETSPFPLLTSPFPSSSSQNGMTARSMDTARTGKTQHLPLLIKKQGNSICTEEM